MKISQNSQSHWMAIPVVAVVLLTMGGCGSSKTSMDPRIVTGIVVLPFQPVADSSAAPPQNQASFRAYVKYSDGSANLITSGVQWSYDSAQWVSFSGSTATCVQPAPQVIGNVPAPSQVTAAASVNGISYAANSQLSCF